MRPGPGPDWAPLSMRMWIAEDLHRTLTTAIHHLTDHLPGHCDTGVLLDDLRYHAGMLAARLTARRAELATTGDTMTEEDPI